MVVDGGTIRMSGNSTSFGRAFTVNAGGVTLESAGSGLWTLQDEGSSNRAISYAAGAATVLTGTGNAQLELVISSGSGTLTKNGAGTWTLTRDNTYTGNTNVNVGTLVINGNQSVATGAVSVSGTLAGSGGTVGGNTTINAGGRLAVGNGTAGSTGTETFSGTLTFTSTSIFDWNINSPTTNQAGADQGTYDQVVNTIATQMSGKSVFNIILGSGKSFTDAFWDTDKTWTNVFSGTGLATVNLSDIFTSFTNNGAALTAGLVPGEGTFSFGATGTSLAWTAVPEPTSALVGLLIGAGFLRRRV